MLVPLQAAEKQVIRRQSNLAGVMLLSMLVLSSGLSLVLGFLQAFGVNLGLATETVNGTLTAANPNAYLLTNLFFYVAVMGIPAVIGCLLLRSSGLSMATSRPVSPTLWVGYLMLGMGLCVFANMAAYGTQVAFSVFSLFPSETPGTADGTWLNWLISVIGTALLPAILEELLFRGVTITLLKPAGDRVAVLVSAIVFALSHSTLTQVPFTFVLGLMFGFLYIRTGNLLLPMALHFLNNAMAVTIESLAARWGDELATSLIYTVFTVLALFGLIAAAFLQAHSEYPLRPLGDRRSTLAPGTRFHAAMFAPALVVFAVLSLLALPLNIEYDPSRLAETTDAADDSDWSLFGDGGDESAVITWN